VEDLLSQARAQHAAGAVSDAMQTCAALIERCTESVDPAIIAEAATMMRRPVDPLLRARAHALAAEALVLLNAMGTTAGGFAARVRAQLNATRDAFHAEPLAESAPPSEPEDTFAELQTAIGDAQHPLRASDRLDLAQRGTIALARDTLMPTVLNPAAPLAGDRVHDAGRTCPPATCGSRSRR